MDRRTVNTIVVGGIGSILFIRGFLRLAPGLIVLGGYSAGRRLRRALSN
jgi:hypothetical protein